MKIERTESSDNSSQPLLGAKVIFTKHSANNWKMIEAQGNTPWLTLSKVYEVTSYDNCGDPCITDDNGWQCDAAIADFAFDIISMPDKQPEKFKNVVITLESMEEVTDLYCGITVDNDLAYEFERYLACVLDRIK